MQERYIFVQRALKHLEQAQLYQIVLIFEGVHKDYDLYNTSLSSRLIENLKKIHKALLYEDDLRSFEFLFIGICSLILSSFSFFTYLIF